MPEDDMSRVTLDASPYVEPQTNHSALAELDAGNMTIRPNLYGTPTPLALARILNAR